MRAILTRGFFAHSHIQFSIFSQKTYDQSTAHAIFPSTPNPLPLLQTGKLKNVSLQPNPKRDSLDKHLLSGHIEIPEIRHLVPTSPCIDYLTKTAIMLTRMTCLPTTETDKLGRNSRPHNGELLFKECSHPIHVHLDI